MKLLNRLECSVLLGKSYCEILPLLAAAAPSIIGAFTGGGSGGGATLGNSTKAPSAAAQPEVTNIAPSQESAVRVDTTVIGAPININLGGNQAPDTSLGGGRYTDQGGDTPAINAPFGTLQDVMPGQRTINTFWDGRTFRPLPDSWYRSDGSPGVGGSSVPVVVWIGGGLIVLAVGFGILKRRKV